MEAKGLYYLGIEDYVIFSAMMIVSTGIGVGYAIAGRRGQSRESFFVGNRQMHWFPVAISLWVSYESSIMMLGSPAEAYVYGAAFMVNGLGAFVGHLLASVMTPALFRPLQITSGFEYLERRFNSKPVRIIGVILALTSTIIYMGIVLYGPAVALEAVTGLQQWYSIIGLSACAVIFTSIGGIKSVIWCDVFQAVVMLVGIFAVIIKATIDIGGTKKVWEYAYDGGRLGGFSVNPDPTVRHTVWTQFVPSMARSLVFTINQSSIQRICSAKSDKGAKKMLILSSVLTFFSGSIVVYEGLVLYSYFSVQPIEPITNGVIANPNQIVPFAVLKLFHEFPGMPGLFLAALFSASLSTISSGYSSMSILLMEDITGPFLNNTPEGRATFYAKLSVVLIGIVACLVCGIITFIEGPLNQIMAGLLSSAGGPLSGLFILAIFFPSVEHKGAIAGSVCGFIFSTVLAFGQTFVPGVKKTPWLPLGNSTCPFNIDHSPNATVCQNPSYDASQFFNMSYSLNAMLGIIVTMTVGFIVSVSVGKNKPGDVDSKHFLEISDTLLIWLPPPLRRWLKKQGSQFKAGWEKKVKGTTYAKDIPENEFPLVPKA